MPSRSEPESESVSWPSFVVATWSYAVADVLPARVDAPVVEGGLAVQEDVDAPMETGRGAHEDVAGVGVARGPAVPLGPGTRPVPRADGEEVGDREPPAARLPGRRERHGARDVLAVRRHRAVLGREAERACGAVEDRAEDARVVRAREAQPLDRARRARRGRCSRSPRGTRSRRSAGRSSRGPRGSMGPSGRTGRQDGPAGPQGGAGAGSPDLPRAASLTQARHTRQPAARSGWAVARVSRTFAG